MNDSLDLLREALPYIQHFDGKVFIIKLSGKVTENKEYLKSLMEEVALFQQVGFYVVLVHGGGKQLTEMANKLDVPQTIVDGRRVTDGKTLELAKMVFAGQIRTDILSTLRQMGAKLSGSPVSMEMCYTLSVEKHRPSPTERPVRRRWWTSGMSGTS